MKNTLSLLVAFDVPGLPNNRAEIYKLVNGDNEKIMVLVESPVNTIITGDSEQLFKAEKFTEPVLATFAPNAGEWIPMQNRDLYQRKVNYFEALEFLETYNITPDAE